MGGSRERVGGNLTWEDHDSYWMQPVDRHGVPREPPWP